MSNYNKIFMHIKDIDDSIVGEISGMAESYCGKIKYYNIKFYKSIVDKRYVAFLISTGHLWFTPCNLISFLKKYSLHTDQEIIN